MSSRTSIRSRISRIEILELMVVYTFHMAKTCTFERPMYPKTHTYASNSFLSVMLSSQSLPCNLQRFPSCCQKVLLPAVETSYGSSRAARKTIFLLAIFKHHSCNCEPVRKCVIQDWKFMKILLTVWWYVQPWQYSTPMAAWTEQLRRAGSHAKGG